MHKKKPRPGFQAATLLAGVIMLLIIFVSAGYILTLPAPDQNGASPDPRLEEVERQRNLWRRRQPEAYVYVVDRDCDCPDDYAEPYRVTVDATGTSFRYDGDYRSSLFGDRPEDPADIEQLFDLVQAAIVSGQSVQVFYDTEYGYPAIARINREDARPVEEFAFDVRDFRVIR